MCQEIQNITKESTVLQSSVADALKLARIFFYSASTPILFLDDQYVVIMVNSSRYWPLGGEEKELVGRPISTFLAKEQTQDFFSRNQSLHQDEEYWQGEFLFKKSDCSPIPVQVISQRVELRDQTIYVLYMEKVLTNAQERPLPEAQREISGAEGLLTAPQSLEKGHYRYQQRYAHYWEGSLLPSLQKMFSEPDFETSKNYRDLIVRELSSVLNNFSLDGDSDLLKLTPTEMDVCKYIQSGLSSKEIAELMHSSFDTIQTHRKNIRKKMGINGQKTPLCTFLRVKKPLLQRSFAQA